jgi:hypothetical protein
LLDKGKVTVSRHAEKRMAEREVDMVDVLNVLRGGHLSPDKLTTFEHGT